MKHFLNILLLIALSFLTGLKCKKEPLFVPPEPALPPITTEGKNTFGCLVDGKLYLPKEPNWMNTAYIREYYDSRSSDLKGSLKIGARRNKVEGEPTYQTVEFRLNNRVYNTGKYILYTDSSKRDPNTQQLLLRNYVRYSKEDLEIGERFDSYYVINPYAGELNILRLDTTYNNRVISGTFWFDAVGKEGDTIRIREGRFDFKL